MGRIYNKIISLFKKDKFPFEIEDCRAEISKKDTSGQIIRSHVTDVNPYLIDIYLNIKKYGFEYKKHLTKVDTIRKHYISRKGNWKQFNWLAMNQDMQESFEKSLNSLNE